MKRLGGRDVEEEKLNQACSLGRLGRYQEALTACEEAIQLQSTLEAAYFYQESALYHLGRWEEAIQSYAALLAVKPDSVLAHFRRALIFLYGFDRFSEAIEALNQVIHFNPKHDEAYRVKAVCLHLLGRYEEALESVDNALELYPYLAETHFTRGSILHYLKRPEEGKLSDQLAHYLGHHCYRMADQPIDLTISIAGRSGKLNQPPQQPP
jgi:tetratricopeptide (TPR) repeat protein